jgi:hypothetical protein
MSILPQLVPTPNNTQLLHLRQCTWTVQEHGLGGLVSISSLLLLIMVSFFLCNLYKNFFVFKRLLWRFIMLLLFFKIGIPFLMFKCCSCLFVWIFKIIILVDLCFFFFLLSIIIIIVFFCCKYNYFFESYLMDWHDN